MAVNAGNNQAEATLFDREAVSVFAIGDTSSVGITGEFRAIVGDEFRQNDLVPLLNELLYGDGVDGVELNSIDNDTVALELTNAGGEIGAVALGAVNVANDRPQFGLFDLDVSNRIEIGSTSGVGTTGEFARLVGDSFAANDTPSLLDELLYGDGVGGVEINTLDDDSLTLELTNAGGVTDIVALDNVNANLDLALGFVDAGDGRPQFALFDVAAGDAVLFFNTDEVGNGEFADVVGDEIGQDDLPRLFAEVLEGDGIDGVELLTVDDDSFTVALTTAGGVVDTVLFDSASAILSDVFA